MKLAPIPTKQYIEQRDEEYWLEGTRISLDSVVYSFLNGESPESIAQKFPNPFPRTGLWCDRFLSGQSRACRCLSEKG